MNLLILSDILSEGPERNWVRSGLRELVEADQALLPVVFDPHSA